MSCCSSCGVSAGSRAARIGDPIARKLAGGCARRQSMGLIGVWPSDVADLKARIDPSMKATDRGVASCASLSANERKAWADFFAAWERFRDSDVPWFGSAAKYDEADAYRVSLGGWQELLTGQCAVAGPKVGTEPEGAMLSSTVKWGAAAVIAVAVVYGVRTIVR